MCLRKHVASIVCDERATLHSLLNRLKQTWDNYESYLATLEHPYEMEKWTYRTLTQKQLYRYVLRLIKTKDKGENN